VQYQDRSPTSPHPDLRLDHCFGVRGLEQSARLESEPEDGHILLHTFNMSAVVRVAVTLRSDLLEEIDRIERNRNRSRFIALAAEGRVTLSRRLAFLNLPFRFQVI